MAHHLIRAMRSSPLVLHSPTRVFLPLRAISPLPRHASTATATEARSPVTILKNIFFGTSITLFLAFSYIYITDTRASVHQWLVVPSLRWIYPDAEDAHAAGTKILKALYDANLHPRERGSPDEKGDLQVFVFGQALDNPIGTSAGIDKLGEIPDALLALGGAVVEVGGATPYAQEGNPKPRVFRLPSQKALINRYGLNSKGADDMAYRLRQRVRAFAYRAGLGMGEDAEQMVLDGEAGVPPGSLTKGKLMLVQIAKGKDTPEGDIAAVTGDYVYCVEKLAKYADVLVVNVSSPNTPGLRDLQAVAPLTEILKGVVDAAQRTNRRTKPKVMVKVSPDEDEESQLEGIAEAVWRSGVDGVIVGNTTKRRQGLIPDIHNLSWKERRILEEQGGYSGPQMFERTLALVKRYRTLLDRGPPKDPEPAEKSGTDTPVRSDEDVKSTILEKVESVKEAIVGKPAPERKVIFATGGITNGAQALEVLAAGASVAMTYTAVVYGGSGKISEMKREMRAEIGEDKKI